MTLDDMQKLMEQRRVQEPQTVDMVSMLQDKTDRTLIWGYMPDSDSFHVYLKEGTIVRLVYNRDDEEPQVMAGTEFLPADLAPTKRVYPEASDAEFCGLLQKLGVEFAFTTFNPKREPEVFHGKTLEDFGKTLADYVEAAPAGPGMR